MSGIQLIFIYIPREFFSNNLEMDMPIPRTTYRMLSPIRADGYGQIIELGL